MTWWKADTRIQSGPRILQVERAHGIDAARLALLTWMALCAANAEHDCEGNLAAIYSHPTYLRAFCPLVADSEISASLLLLREVGLVDLPEDGSVIFTGWDDSWRVVLPSTARVRAHRARKARKDKGE